MILRSSRLELRHTPDFFSRAKKHSSRYWSAYVLPPSVTSHEPHSSRAKVALQAAPPQLAFVVSKSVAPLAVTRNRIKRRLRAASQVVLPELTTSKSGWQFVIVARNKQLATLSFPQLCQELLHTLA